MAVSDTLIDTLFDRRYRIVRKLGAGGMANVYLAEDQELGRRVAIKILNDRHANDDQFVERFRREAKNAAGLSHPNIVSVYDRGEAEGTYYIAMEHLDGRSLKELIVARGPAPIPVAIDYARQILAALRFAHRNGIVHRDIKPHNVLVDGEGRLKVTDFGIARAGASTQMTEVGSIIGTAQYLSPEQARGAPVDQRSDLYSLGIVLYELLTGTVPFGGDAPVEIAMKHLSSTPTPPSAKRAEIPRELDLVVMRALAKDPARRYATAEEMDSDLERISRGASVSNQTNDAATAIIAEASAMPTTISRAPARAPAAPTARPQALRQAEIAYEYAEPVSRRRPFWPWLLALALLVAAGAAGWYVYDQIQEQLDETRPAAVPFVEGVRKPLALRAIREAGFEPRVQYRFDDEVPVGFVIEQQPDAGDRIERGNIVMITASYGRERVRVPSLRGRSATDAAAALASVGLKDRIVEVNSAEDDGTVTAQDPKPGQKVPKNTVVRINVSKGPRPIGVPSVIGQTYESASGALQAQNFAVARRDVDSDQPEGLVVEQSPSPGSFVPRGSSVTLGVSKGPTTVGVPDVTSLDRESARDALLGSGFKVRTEFEDTDDPSLENVVLSQDPPASSEAEPGTRVTIVVGRFVGIETDVPATTEPPPTSTEPPPTSTGESTVPLPRPALP
ncbi:MAG: Stk1 family PASTA domain-containing Ser/Thr kinase [Actinobacteria bacterium]|nr:Stk1 family PASTA domain-containing Ser/Thr kinase [Actinomycetota bacterium]